MEKRSKRINIIKKKRKLSRIENERKRNARSISKIHWCQCISADLYNLKIMYWIQFVENGRHLLMSLFECMRTYSYWGFALQCSYCRIDNLWSLRFVQEIFNIIFFLFSPLLSSLSQRMFLRFSSNHLRSRWVCFFLYVELWLKIEIL